MGQKEVKKRLQNKTGNTSSCNPTTGGQFKSLHQLSITSLAYRFIYFLFLVRQMFAHVEVKVFNHTKVC